MNMDNLQCSSPQQGNLGILLLCIYQRLLTPRETVKFVMQQQIRNSKLGLSAVHHNVTMFISIALRIKTVLRFGTARTITMINCKITLVVDLSCSLLGEAP